MRTLIVEDDFTSRSLLQELLKDYGVSHIAVNGLEAVNACTESINNKEFYDLICLDIMMPEMDGKTALRLIRNLEDVANIPFSSKAKIVLTTALDDVETVMGSLFELCDGYLVKPFTQEQLTSELIRLALV